jgi:hypothetical protein
VRHRLAPIEGQKEIAWRLKAVQKENDEKEGSGKERGDERKLTRSMGEELTVGVTLKIVVFTILACTGFCVLWGITFFLSFAFTLNIVLSLVLGFIISAVTTFALITVLIPPRKRVHVALSKRQTVGAYVAWSIIFALSLPLIKINPLLFLSGLPASIFVTLLLIYATLRGRKGKETAQK